MTQRILIILATLLLLAACTDNIPRGRPTLSLDTPLVTQEDLIDDEQLEDEVVQRPSGAILIQADACACKNGEPISIGDCAGICANKQSNADENSTLFFNVQLTEAITLDIYQDVAGWCSTLPGEETSNQCNIEVKDEDGAILTLPFDPAPGATAFSLDVGGVLDFDETYRITITESTSQARSTTIQLRLFSELIDDTIGGPLALMPVNNYACLFRDGFFDEATGELIIENVSRFHFYFIPETRPEPLTPATVPTVNCYDIEAYGNTPINSPLLEESTGVFTAWNKDDPRFFDLSGNGTRRIHELIEQNVELQGQSLANTPELFFPLTWQNGFDDGNQVPGQPASSNLSTTSAQLGFYMAPFLDEVTFKAYCPTRLHYYSDSPLFRAMREVVAVDTEALYAAKQNNVCDFLLIKESLLKQIWFYIEGGQHIEPTNNTVQGKQVQFYWPPDVNSPFIKKSHQRVYTIKGSTEITCNDSSLNDGGQNSGGVPSNIPPHDKRIGCVPVLGD